MENTQFIMEVDVGNGEDIEVHRCPACDGVFGIDVTFLDQVSDNISCSMCDAEIHVSEPENV